MEWFRISELSKEFEVSTRSIRFYEDEGLLTPRREGQTRWFNRRDKVRLKLILRGKRLGFSLAEIRELFDLYDHHESKTQLETMVTLIDEKQQELERKRQDLDAVMAELTAARERCIEALTTQA
ncbi:MerR family transcriptional regulator [Thaumasiovibrio subtropicus]|uniref:MerR family transcriptional regulator n=1 Tax=Thaumasiovibrio subtropicus TaxID=1891207 RepID=UPI000B3564B2|nr:MerR family DNA-binding transcriptional regulator [Thaumasiovibrio subtropicus]